MQKSSEQNLNQSRIIIRAEKIETRFASLLLYLWTFICCPMSAAYIYCRIERAFLGLRFASVANHYSCCGCRDREEHNDDHDRKSAAHSAAFVFGAK